MEKFKFSVNAEQEQPVQRTRLGHGKCEVYGCPRDGHIQTGVWSCRYHFGKSGVSLARITMTLRNHEKEFDWFERMLNTTVVDFAMGIAANAPDGMSPLQNETLAAYKARIGRYIDDLFVPKNRSSEIAP